MDDQRLITIQGVEYPNGEREACYALGRNDVAVCVSIKRATELQREGLPYFSGQFTPDQFATFLPPDFAPIGG